jgi:hypothetical protein
MAMGDLIDPPVFNSEDVWIRKFKDASTRVRFIPSEGMKRRGKGTQPVKVFGAEAWPSELEHYARGIGSFPCSTPHGGDCGGCSDEDEKVQKRQRFWYANALDEKGTMRVYKFGKTLKETLQLRESHHPDGASAQPLSMKDHTIHRMGTGFDTKYDPEPGEVYKIDFNDMKPHDITKLLVKQVEDARLHYNGDDVDDSHYAGMEQASATLKQPEAKADVPKVDPWNDPSDELIDGATTVEIKKYLDDKEVDYPSRAPRARLIEMAKKEAAPPY